MSNVIERIDNRLFAIINSPKVFGGQEAREMLAKALLEIRAVAKGGNGYDTHGNMVKFIRDNVDSECGANPLSARKLPEVLFGKLLDQFIQEQRTVQDMA